MGANAQVKMSSRTQYSRYLGDFRGVDFSSSPAMVAQNRFSYLKNMWKDYESGQGQAIETMPGYRVVLSALAGKGRIHSIHEYRDSLMVKCGTSLYFCKFDNHGNNLTVGNTGNPVATGLKSGAITGFVFNNDFWFLDGKQYYCYTYGNSSCVTVTSSAYVPTTYIDGEEYEQRNILTNKFIEKSFVGGGVALRTESTNDVPEGLLYNVTTRKIYNESDELIDEPCINIYGCSVPHDYLMIPESISDNGKNYRVLSIADDAFSEYACKSVSIPEHCLVGKNAFYGCKSLETVMFRESHLSDLNATTAMLSKCFSNCPALKEIYVGVSVRVNVATDAFDALTEYSNLKVYLASGVPIAVGKQFPYSQNESGEYTNIIQNTPIPYLAVCEITLFEPCKSISTAEVPNGVVRYNETLVSTLGWTVVPCFDSENDYITKIIVFAKSALEAGDEFTVEGTGEYSKLSTSKNGGASIYDANASYDASTADSALNVLRKCTVTAIFDGRIFFTGNPDLPNTVLYSARDLTSANNPAYIGVYNYFNDGVGDKRNTAMISTPSMLIVCKENTKQDGSCWYHVGQDTGYDLIPRVYPSTQGVAGIGCVGAATNFADDPVFLSTEGLMAIGKQTVNLERTVEHRSSNIDLKLKQCNLKGARMAEWKGYLVILVDGQMFLADSRQLFQHDTGVTQYEWYYADDIGVYTGQTQMVSTTTGCLFATVDGKTVDLTAPEYTDRLTYSQNGGNSGIVYVNSDSESERHDNTELLATNAAILLDGVDTGLKFPVVQTDRGAYLATYVDQYSGGNFSPAECLCVMDDRLLLGTAHGEVLCFNTDRRGKTVWRAIRRPEGFTPAEDDTRVYADPSKDMIWTDEDDAPTVETPDGTYAVITTGAVSYLAERLEVEPDEIWQGFYNRNGREIMAVCETLCDSSAYPQIAKNTVRKSIVVRSKSMGSSEYSVFVRSNREQEWRECRRTSRMGSTLDLEFRNLSYLTSDIVISVVPDRLKRWQWQQFRFESAGYCKPFGLLDLFYRYENGGNIK